ncbi:uncharacterized protein PFLUO_LOCUS2811 [Penicillium psychrofluorescens]|uniref:uncharacterized protein n=1 Tax=Penicillium psychrofluorescens TaxID=3158075 RepID=UPI003CCDF157
MDAFSTVEPKSTDNGVSSENDGQWLSAGHIRALGTLRSALEREEESGATESTNWAGMAPNMVPQFGLGPDGFMDMPSPLDISPVTYLDSIMNAPMFDYTQENAFL